MRIGAAGRNAGSTIVSLQNCITMEITEEYRQRYRERCHDELVARYDALCVAFGVYSGAWSMIHEHYSPSMFCIENRHSLIGEYLVWEEFVRECNKYQEITGERIPFYFGILTFLEEYQRAVFNCLKDVEEKG